MVMSQTFDKEVEVMRMKSLHIAVGLLSGVLLSSTAIASEQLIGEAAYGHGNDAKLPGGVIGISLHVGAERIGDPAVLYVGMVHPEGPAQQAGLRHGDEVLSVDGTPVTGKTFEQVVKMIRGEAGTIVKLEVKVEGSRREVSLSRVAGDKLSKGPMGSHGGAAR
jgi:C-terminal processing protease CtpA/Prc